MINIPNFATARVLVIGDVMLDRYWTGDTKRISPEAPVPVVKINKLDERPGGAGNVAVNLASLGIMPKLFGVIGNDEAGLCLQKKLQAHNIETHLQNLANYPTVTKLRVLSFHQQLIRLDFEESYYEAANIDIESQAIDHIKDSGAVIISDYHKGSLKNIHKIIAAANHWNVPIFVDPKGETFSVYRGADVLTPNRKEFEAIVGPCKNNQELEAKAKQALIDHEIGALLITRGSEGMSLIRRDKDPIHLSARAYDVYDVTGAGDTVIAVFAAAVASGCDLADAMFLANVGAGIVVTKLGAAAVNVSELRRALRKMQQSQLGVLTEAEAIEACNDARAKGEKVVMTNGCFDILHPGHIAYLEEAKSLGHRLIIAVNSDESVSRLKGPHRPVKNLQDRMTILAALRSVDWVVPFQEDTPARLIGELKPNILVKGVDYKIEDIAGHEFVLANGGEVKLVGPEKQWSSTELVEKMAKKDIVV